MFYLISKSRKPITTNSHLKFLPKICWTFFSHELLSDFGGACGRLKRRRRGVPQICTLPWRLKRSPEKEPASPSVADHRSWLLTTSNLPTPNSFKAKRRVWGHNSPPALVTSQALWCAKGLSSFFKILFFFLLLTGYSSGHFRGGPLHLQRHHPSAGWAQHCCICVCDCVCVFVHANSRQDTAKSHSAEWLGGLALVLRGSHFGCCG